jgi:hypothetical protein
LKAQRQLGSPKHSPALFCPSQTFLLDTGNPQQKEKENLPFQANPENLYPASRIDAQDGQGRAFLLRIQIGK